MGEASEAGELCSSWESLQNMIPGFIASVDAMLEKWKGREDKEMDVFEEIRVLTSEMISRSAFGTSYLQGEKMFDMLNKLSAIVGRVAMKKKIPLIDKIWKSADFVESEQLVKAIEDCVMEIVKIREEKVVNGEADSFGDDFLGILVSAYRDSNDKNRLSMDDLVDECKLFFLAAQATVNSLIAWAIMVLSIHQDWQEKARMEVIEIFGDRNPDSNGIAKLKIITMIIHETERLYGQPSPLMRKVEREARLGELVLPADIDLRLATIAVHHDTQLWGDDAHLFKPDRFAEGIAKVTRNNAAVFFPFGLGPRTCVGMSFAYTEAKIALSMILQRYTISLSPAYVHSPQVHLSLRPGHGIQVILHSLD
ncbi:cytochrome P450 CYP749A22-like [Hibiscus syriacus]|uniref:cytochrome P450 CYP749A22-like n=1 Tax=Hibiscus syriacus TaxID=106335 RepID=UPI0019233F74|nr:cytochrome P450 CYP749A22-like [Hibiscus syriacus]